MKLLNNKISTRFTIFQKLTTITLLGSTIITTVIISQQVIFFKINNLFLIILFININRLPTNSKQWHQQWS